MRWRGAFGLTLFAAACGSATTTTSDPTPRVAESSPPPAPVTPSTPPAQTSAAAPAPPPPMTMPPPTAASCFAALKGKITGPDYDQFKPAILPSCSGTHHQSITGVEKLVFLGDSITVGTPPTLIQDFYSTRLVKALTAKNPTLEWSSCAKWGAQTNDLLQNDDQLGTCFPNPTEPKKTLVVMTMGGNDIAGLAKSQATTADAMTSVDQTIANLRAAIDWLKSPGRFPNGVWVVFANVYEYTDTSGDLASCPAASLSGFKGSWPEGAPAVVHLQEQYMKVAVDTGTDMMFLLEHFCGHGYKRDDPTLQCYRGPNTPLWFDLTCYHPNPDGHGQVADLFLNVINGI